MSELKVYGFSGNYYLKSEADKVITELEDKLKVQTSNAEEAWKLEDVYRTSYAEAVKELYDKNKEIAELKEERRWRNFSEERPKDKQWIFVFVENPSKYGTYIELRRWDMGCKFDVEDQELYTKWMPQPSAPKEAK